jgi:murein peptide amidase A
VLLAQPATSPPAFVRREATVGRSVRGRPIVAIELGDPSSPRKVLVLGCIHGNEPAGIAIADALAHGAPPTGTDLWVVPDLNPDGVAADTRQNADGVDLNRNFPWGWRALGPRGSTFYSGLRPLSEPESRVAYTLIRRLRPAVTIWFHQHLGLVDESGGRASVERRFARLTGLPLRRLTRYPGSATTWENHVLTHSTAFVVELPPGAVPDARIGVYTHAIRVLAGGS